MSRPLQSRAFGAWALLCGFVLAACSGSGASTDGAPGTGGAGGSGGPGGEPDARIMAGLGFVGTSFGFYYPGDVDDGIEGFDLDGVVSEGGGQCAHEDFLGLRDQTGIDYNFLRVANNEETREDGKYVFGGFREGQIVDGVIDGATKNGSMTILLQVMGVDDFDNDENVTIQVYASEDSPALGTDGSVLTGATLSVHSDPRFHSGEVQGQIVDGELIAGPIDLLFPIDIMIVEDELLIHDSFVRLRVDDGSFAGIVSGYWDVANIRSIVGVPTTDNGNAANFTIEQFDAAMAEFADGDFDEDLGRCTSISTTFRIRGIQAYLASDGGPMGAGGTGGGDGGGDPQLVDQCLSDADQAALAALETPDRSGPAVVGDAAAECPTSECGTEVGAVLSDTSEAARNALGDCIAQCISNRTGLSTQCTACYGSIAACSTAFCIAPCINDPGSEECANCALENCIDVNACTGF